MEKITLNMTPSACLTTCHASQYDIGRQVRFDLVNGADAFVLSGAETVTLKIRRADGVLVENAVPNTSSNYVIWTSAAGECDAAGVSECELRVTDGDDVLGSANFLMSVEADAYDGRTQVKSASGAIATFETGLADALVSAVVNVLATGGNGTPDSPIPINGYTEANIVNTQNKSIVDLFSIDSDFRGTVAFNQLVDKSKFITVTQTDYTLTPNNDGSITVVIINTLTSDKDVGLTANLSSSYFIVPNTHKFAILDNNISISDILYRNDYNGVKIGVNTIKQQTQANGYIYLAIKLPSGLTPQTFTIKPQIIDLTQMFGSTIADYIYSLEQATPGAGVAFFRSIYPADYYDYDAGTNELVGKETPNATVNFGQTVYGGVLDVTRGKLHVTHGVIVLDGTQEVWISNWRPQPNSVGWYYHYDLTNNKIMEPNEVPDMLCNVSTAQTYNNMYNNDIIGVCCYTSNYAGLFVRVADTSLTTPTAINAYLTNNPMTITYPLATPFDIDLTPEVISAVVGTNNVFADCGDIAVEYLDLL